MAFIIILSVFNGFDMVVRDLFNSFYADLEVVPVEGKTFLPLDDKITQIKKLEGVRNVASMLEDNALLIFEDRQTIGTVRGVSDNYAEVTGIDTMMYDGNFSLSEEGSPMAVIGRGIAYYLGINPDFVAHLQIMVPKRTSQISMDPNRALNTKYIKPGSIFASQPDLDAKYILVPLRFAQQLFDYNNEISAYEIGLTPEAYSSRIQDKIQTILGKEYSVKNRIQQNDLLYKTMKSEKWAIFFILVFILLVSSFNVVGSLTMLIIEKKNDIQTLRYLGAQMKTIRRTFMIEGLIIALAGAIAGLILGSLICYIQQEYGIVKLSGSSSFVIDSYPVKIIFSDVLLVLIAVTGIGLFASWYPIRFITRRYLSIQN